MLLDLSMFLRRELLDELNMKNFITHHAFCFREVTICCCVENLSPLTQPANILLQFAIALDVCINAEHFAAAI